MDDSYFFLMMLLELLIAGIIGIVILIKILHRNPKNRLNQIFSMVIIYLLFGFTIFIINFQMRDQFLNEVSVFLDTTLHHCFMMLLGFMLLYITILYKPEIMIKLKNELIFILIYGILATVIFFIPNASTVDIGPDGNIIGYKWNITMLLYYTIFLITALLIYSIIMIKTLSNITNQILKKKIKIITIATVSIFIVIIGDGLFEFININPISRIIWGSIELVLIVIGVVLLYYALGFKLIDDD